MSDYGRKRPDSRPPDPSAPALGRTITPRDPQCSRTSTPSTHPTGTPPVTSQDAGALAVGLWLRDRGVYPPTGKQWRVQIALEVNDRPASFMFAPTKFQVTIEPSAWGYMFVHGNRSSTIQVTNIASARDADEHRLLAMTPPLRRLGALVRDVEARYRLFFPRHHAAVRSDIAGSEPMIRAWVSSF